MGTYEVWTEPPVAELRSIRFLAGFRRSAHFDGGRESRCRRNWSRIVAGGKYWLYISRMNDGEVRGAYLGSN